MTALFRVDLDEAVNKIDDVRSLAGDRNGRSLGTVLGEKKRDTIGQIRRLER